MIRFTRFDLIALLALLPLLALTGPDTREGEWEETPATDARIAPLVQERPLCEPLARSPALRL